MKVLLPYALGGVQPGNPVEVPDAEARSLLRQGIARPVGDTETPGDGSDDESDAQSASVSPPAAKSSGKSRTRKTTASKPAGDGEDGEPADEQAADTDTKEA